MVVLAKNSSLVHRAEEERVRTLVGEVWVAEAVVSLHGVVVVVEAVAVVDSDF